MKSKLLFLAAILTFCQGIQSQEFIESFQIRHNNRTKKLKCEWGNYLRINTIFDTTSGIDSTGYVHGDIISVSHAGIEIAPRVEVKLTRNNGESSYSTRSWQQESSYAIQIDASNIQSIRYQSVASQRWGTVGGSALVIGCLTSFVVAPLISINYQNRTLNVDRYYKTAAIGLGLITVSIPILVLSREKTYHFKATDDRKRNKIWKLE